MTRFVKKRPELTFCSAIIQFTFLLTDNEFKKTEFKNWRVSYPYPQNLARNVACKGDNTRFTLVLDIDVIPSADSARTLAKFLAIN